VRECSATLPQRINHRIARRTRNSNLVCGLERTPTEAEVRANLGGSFASQFRPPDPRRTR